MNDQKNAAGRFAHAQAACDIRQRHCITLTTRCKCDLKLLLVALGQTGIIPKKMCTRLIIALGLKGE